MTGLEIERKFLLIKPSFSADVRYVQMVQTYLAGYSGTARVRQVTAEGVKKYYFTHKKRITAVTCIETEREIDENEYQTLLLKADPTLRPIEKTRYYYPYKDLTFEIDVYPFWEKQCVMEVELEREDQSFEIPKEFKAIREVTHCREYKNFALAKRVPEESI